MGPGISAKPIIITGARGGGISFFTFPPDPGKDKKLIPVSFSARTLSAVSL